MILVQSCSVAGLNKHPQCNFPFWVILLFSTSLSSSFLVFFAFLFCPDDFFCSTWCPVLPGRSATASRSPLKLAFLVTFSAGRGRTSTLSSRWRWVCFGIIFIFHKLSAVGNVLKLRWTFYYIRCAERLLFKLVLWFIIKKRAFPPVGKAVNTMLDMLDSG